MYGELLFALLIVDVMLCVKDNAYIFLSNTFK